MTGTYHDRNPDKHEYEIQAGSSHEVGMVYVGTTEKAAVASATASFFPAHPDEDHVRLYHTYPSPGPVRRYVGVIRDGKLHRAA